MDLAHTLDDLQARRFQVAPLGKLGARWRLLDTGCCGMAGSFGFSADHYDPSMKIAEDSLLPQLRATPEDADAIVITSGFSCSEQIEHGSGRHALHIAQLALKTPRRNLPPRQARYIPQMAALMEQRKSPRIRAGRLTWLDESKGSMAAQRAARKPREQPHPRRLIDILNE